MVFAIKRRCDAQRGSKSTHYVDGTDVGMFFRGFHATTKTQHDPGRGLDEIVIPQIIGARATAGPTETIELAEDHPRIHRLKAGLIQAQRCQLAIGRVHDDDIDLPHKTIEHLSPFGRVQVNQYTFLAPCRRNHRS